MNRLLRSLALPLVGLAFACSGAPAVGPHGLVVDATVSAATLGDQCSASSSVCAAGVDCRTPCQQSNLQLELTADTGSGPVAVAITEARVLRPDGSLYQRMTANTPTEWNGTNYVGWDQQLAAGTTLKVGYDLTAQSSSDATRVGASETYRVEVDIVIDTVQRTISIEGVTPAPILST